MKNPLPDLQWETQFGHPSFHVIGVDEVGRGSLAGPVAAGALALPLSPESFSHSWISEIADSKCLKPKDRERLAPLIEAWSPACAIGVATVEEIDEINIYHAAHLAMKRAIERVVEKLKSAGLEASHILIDGNALPKALPVKATAIVKGDMKCLSIAASSIIAKVWRDREMDRYETIHPGYEFGGHKGYSTPRHLARLQELGACPIHRRSFAPVTEQLRKTIL